MKAKKVFAMVLAAALTLSSSSVLYAASESSQTESTAQEKNSSEETAEPGSRNQEADSKETESGTGNSSSADKKEKTEPKAAEKPGNVPGDTGEIQSISDDSRDTQSTPEDGGDTQSAPENNGDIQSIPENTEDTQSIPEDSIDTQSIPDNTEDTINIPENTEDIQSTPGAKTDANSLQVQKAVGDLVTDSRVAEEIRNTLGLDETEPITKEVLERLTYLNCGGADSLEGLEYAVNLTSLTSNYGGLTDLSPLTGLEKLMRIDVGYNQITEIPSLSQLTNLNSLLINGNPVSVIADDVKSSEILVDLSAEAPAAEEIFRDYVSFEPVNLMENSGSYYVSPVSSHFRIFEASFSTQDNDIIQIDGSYGGSGVQIEILGTGSGTVVAAVGNATKEIPVNISPVQEEVEENENIHTLPQFTDTNSDMLLYDGEIWDLSGEMAETIPSERKVTNYVSCRVYYGNRILSDLTVLDENSTLYYWPANADTGAYESEVWVADNVRTITPTGYIDSEGAYHYWEYQYEEGEARPRELRVVPGVDHVSGNYAYLEDGSAIYFLNTGFFTETTYDLENPIREVKGQYILDTEGILWQRNSNDYEQIADQVTDFCENGAYISQGTLYSGNGQVLDTEVERIEDSGSLNYYVKGKDYYWIRYDDTVELYASDVKSSLDRLFLLNDGTLWVNGTEEGYQILSSVEEISGEYGTYNALRKDGSVWRVNPPLAPYMIFQSEEGPETPEEILWNKTDEATGISATAQGIPDSVMLQVNAVSEGDEAYGQDYGLISDYITGQGGEDFRIYDIKLVDENGGTYQPEDGNMVTVSVPKPETFGESVKVYHQNEDKSMTELVSASEEGTVVFQTPGFSLFALADFGSTEVPEGAEDPQNPEEPENPQNPQEPGSTQDPDNQQNSQEPESSQDSQNPENAQEAADEKQDQELKKTNEVKKGTPVNQVKSGTENKNSVKTGDETPVVLYGCLALAGILVLSGVGIYVRKKR
ncbi:MAG TPA: hypothetical protein H9738_10290 [Candidatus Blautia pullistercoris]|uniref:Internalin-A n=1 Tax=Candidatus Blautia pullistercoris TaxID=2838499 RepID=A0A9D2AN25_9FIRM|nr:hypothetical protein [Candidatus Blautia pullistercoris]